MQNNDIEIRIFQKIKSTHACEKLIDRKKFIELN